MEGDLKPIVKDYYSGTELSAAFKALDYHYGRSEMVITECIESIQKLQQLKSEMGITGFKHFLYKLTTSLSTQELHLSPPDIAARELSSIIDFLPKLSLESIKRKFSKPLSI